MYSELCKASKIERFVQTVPGFWLLTVLTERSILDVWQSFECTAIFLSEDLKHHVLFVDLSSSITHQFYTGKSIKADYDIDLATTSQAIANASRQ